MSQPFIIIKLGGSVITDKTSSTPKARTAVIKRLAKEIRQIIDQNKYQLILVHGAGSFGHSQAKKYNLHKGMATQKQKFGFSLTQQAMLNLNSLVTEKLLKEKVPVISLAPHTFTTQSGGKLLNFNYQVVEKYLEKGQVPVLFGDAVLDDKWGCSILSGDVIVSFLAQKLNAHKVIFLSDVDGVFDSNPKKNPASKLIPQITSLNLKQVLGGLSQNNHYDVTGGMQGKILSIQESLKGIKVLIMSGLTPQALVRAVDSGQAGTELLFQ